MAGPIVTGAIPNLINGVSQQAAAVRLASQAEVQENAFSSIVEGLRKRPPTEHVATLSTTAFGSAYLHTINRDTAERYLVVARSGNLRVFTLDGVERTVNAPQGFGYLGSADAASRLSMVTVADHTFVLNRDVVVVQSGEVSTARQFEALLWVKQGSYSSTYRVYWNGAQVASYTTPDGSVASHGAAIQTDAITGQLFAQLTAALPGVTLSIAGSVIYLGRSTDFTLSVSDGIAGNGLKALKGTIQRFSDLPERAWDGFVVQVTGDQTNKFDSYYVKYTAGGSNIGTWSETIKPSTPTSIHPSTMPYLLVREANGTFTFKQAAWEKNMVGDLDTSPWPSFVGRAITDVFFHRNRLGFITDENVCLSRSGDFFNFFRQTTTQLLDTDPIDVGVSHTKVSILRHVLPFDRELLLFSDQTQFILSGSDSVLTPKTVTVNATTEFECSTRAKPVAAGKSAMFATPRGSHSAIREYFTDSDVGTSDAVDITSHVPKYIPSGVFKLAANTIENILLALSDQAPADVYVYQWFWSGNEKVQSAWHKWSFRPGTKVLNVDFIESTAHFVVQDPDGRVRLERMKTSPAQADSYVSFVYHLDSRVATSALTRTYDAVNNRTTFTLPYAPPNTITLVIGQPLGGSFQPGVAVPLTLLSGTQVSAPGNLTAVGAWIGVPFKMRYRFSPLMIRAAAAGGGVAAVLTGRLQLRTMTLTHERSGYYRVVVQPSGNRSAGTYVCTGRVLGVALVGQPAIADGSFRVPLMARNTEVDIELVNDTFLPCQILSAEWTGFYVNHGNRLT